MMDGWTEWHWLGLLLMGMGSLVIGLEWAVLRGEREDDDEPVP